MPVMRERTTWNRSMIAKNNKTAEDPRAMNQDHHQQQPAADAYVTGDPSAFAEDLHPSNQWKVEQGGDGETKRDEIGMPEMRSDTWNHPEKTAADEATALKKADLCVKIAQAMFPEATEAVIEDQALAFMNLPDAELIETSNRLAGIVDAAKVSEDDDDDDDDDQGQQGQGQQGQGQQGQGQQQKQGFSMSEGGLIQAIQSGDQDQMQAAIAQQVQQAMQQNQGMGMDGIQALVSQQVQQAMDQVQQAQQQQQAQGQPDQQAAFYDTAQQDQVQQAQQQQQMGQQQQQGTVPPGIAQQEQLAQQQQMQGQDQIQMSDDQMLDQMLQDMDQGQQQVYATEADIQLDGAQMDVGETPLGAEDAVLTQLFANHNEVQQAAKAQEIQTGVNPLWGQQPQAQPPQAQPQAPTAPVMARTASQVQPRAMGTQPTSGVSVLGGSAGAPSSPSDVSQLQNMWKTAPDVSGVFNQ